WTLSLLLDKQWYVRDSGAVADSIGRSVGFQWQLPKSAFNNGGQRKVKFTIATPREAAVALTKRMTAVRPEAMSNFLLISLSDPNRELAARIVNTWLEEYLSVAAELKKRKLMGFANTLEAQLRSAKSALDSAEIQLSSFKVNNITKTPEG